MSTTMDMLRRLQEKKPAAVAALPATNTAPPIAPVAPGLPAWATAAVDPLTARKHCAPPIGINPPESALPPAPPAAPRRGRPPKARPAATVVSTVTNEALPADTVVSTVTNEAQSIATPVSESCDPPLPPTVDPATVITVVYGKETIQVAPYNPIEIGPFSAAGCVKYGETVSQAMARLNDELVAFADAERARKLHSAATLVQQIQGNT